MYTVPKVFVVQIALFLVLMSQTALEKEHVLPCPTGLRFVIVIGLGLVQCVPSAVVLIVELAPTLPSSLVRTLRWWRCQRRCLSREIGVCVEITSLRRLAA